MTKLKVLKTTDGKYVGRTFVVPDLDDIKSKGRIDGLLRVDYMSMINPSVIRLWNSNYMAIVEIV